MIFVINEVMKIDRFAHINTYIIFLFIKTRIWYFSAILSLQIDLCPVLLFFKIYSTYNLFTLYLCHDENTRINSNLFINLNLKSRNA